MVRDDLARFADWSERRKWVEEQFTTNLARVGGKRLEELGTLGLIQLLTREQEWDERLALAAARQVRQWKLDLPDLGDRSGYPWGMGISKSLLEAAEDYLSGYRRTKGDPFEMLERARAELASSGERLGRASDRQQNQADVDSILVALDDEELRDVAQEVLGKLLASAHQEELALVFVAAIRAERWTLRDKAARALKKMGPTSVNVLAPFADDDEAAVRWSIAHLFGEIGHPSAKDPLVRLLRDQDEGVRDAATSALQLIER